MKLVSQRVCSDASKEGGKKGGKRGGKKRRGRGEKRGGGNGVTKVGNKGGGRRGKKGGQRREERVIKGFKKKGRGWEEGAKKKEGRKLRGREGVMARTPAIQETCKSGFQGRHREVVRLGPPPEHGLEVETASAQTASAIVSASTMWGRYGLVGRGWASVLGLEIHAASRVDIEFRIGPYRRCGVDAATLFADTVSNSQMDPLDLLSLSL